MQTGGKADESCLKRKICSLLKFHFSSAVIERNAVEVSIKVENWCFKH